jgi:hypothetical protein
MQSHPRPVLPASRTNRAQREYLRGAPTLVAEAGRPFSHCGKSGFGAKRKDGNGDGGIRSARRKRTLWRSSLVRTGPSHQIGSASSSAHSVILGPRGGSMSRSARSSLAIMPSRSQPECCWRSAVGCSERIVEAAHAAKPRSKGHLA